MMFPILGTNLWGTQTKWNFYISQPLYRSCVIIGKKEEKKKESEMGKKERKKRKKEKKSHADYKKG